MKKKRQKKEIEKEKRLRGKHSREEIQGQMSLGHKMVFAGSQLLFLFLALLTGGYIWLLCNYGNISFEEIWFTINMPLQGTASHYFVYFALLVVVPVILLTILEYFLWRQFFWKRGRKNYPFILVGVECIWFVAVLLLADSSFGMRSYLQNQMEQSTLIAKEYVDPSSVCLTFPEKKRNLIWIYLESGESSAQDVASGGLMGTNYIPELTEIARENISFSQSEEIEGAAVSPAAGWTIAGLVAETSGLPLKLFTYDDSGVDNSMSHYEYFLPGATSIGELLEEQGYHNVFMAGSDFRFGGRTNYFTQHGNYEICDYKWAIEEGLISEDYKVWWGFEDEKLFAFARDKLTSLAKEDEPFNLSLLTVDTHQPDGYVCRLCPKEHKEQYGNVWSCSSRQVAEFVAWIKEQDFYENTTVIITGDHCSMNLDFYGDYVNGKHYGTSVRKVYNAILNAEAEPAKEKNRRFTTLDFYPTALASLGVTMEGDRLGLGTNLFSEEKTLSEIYGYNVLFEELNKKSIFYNNEILYP